MNIKDANKLLISYGTNFRKEPIFRIVWSDEQFEYRKGVFEERTKESKIYLRTVVGIEKVRKYPYIKGRWVFEKWFPSPGIKELVDSENGIYECIYVFRSGKGEYLPLDEEVIKFIVNSLSKNADHSKVHQLLEEKELKKETKAEGQDKLEVEDTSSLMTTQLHIGEAVSFANTKEETNE